jgi:hypothetical protein
MAMGIATVTHDPLYYQWMVTCGFIFIGFAITGMSLYMARIYRNGLLRPNYFLNPKKTIRNK